MLIVALICIKYNVIKFIMIGRRILATINFLIVYVNLYFPNVDIFFFAIEFTSIRMFNNPKIYFRVERILKHCKI